MKGTNDDGKSGPVLRPVGLIHSPYKEMGDAPFQGRLSSEESVLEIYEEYGEALKDVESSDHLILIYWGHLGNREVLQTVTPWGSEFRGVFACRSPSRPNPVALCVVELLERYGNKLTVKGADAVDGSEIIDIKPYSARVDCVPEAEIGWFQEGAEVTNWLPDNY